MFDQFKAMGAVAGLMKNKERLQEAGEELKERLAAIRAEGEAGGGAVRTVASGDFKIVDVTVSAAAMAASDESSVAMLESLIAEAANEALYRARALAQAEVAQMANELGLPGMPGLGGLLPE